MLRNRVIPSLLIANKRLVKTKNFKKPIYLGDPINAIKIFNEKQADELIIIDIHASKTNQGPNFQLIEEMCSEAFMPIAYGGGIQKIEQIATLFKLGVEKVVLGQSAALNPELVKDAILSFGSQSISCVIDIKKTLFQPNSNVYIQNGKIRLKLTPIEYALHLQELGIGEIIIQDINRDGTRNGYNIELIKLISSKLEIPLIALGGAGSKEDFSEALKNGASGVAAGTFFTLLPPHDAVLIKYLSNEEIKAL